MGFGGTGGSAAAVASGTSAQQDDDISGLGAFPADILRRSGGDYCADLHTFGGITVMIQLVHLSGGQTDLVAVGGVARRSGGDQFLLRKLSFHGLTDAAQRIGTAGDAHGGIHVASAGQRVTDGTADTGGGSAERLDLRRMVVGLVFKQKQPVLIFAVDFYFDLDGAGIDLLGFVQFLELTDGFQIPCADGAHVHEGHGLGAVEILAGLYILVVSRLQFLVVGLDGVDDGVEGGVTAVVGPVGVDDADLRDGGIPVLTAEIIPAADEIAQIHGQTLFLGEVRQLIVAELDEAVQGIYGLGDLVVYFQCLHAVQRSLAALHRVDDMLFDGGHVLFGQIAGQKIDLGGGDGRALALRDDLDALGSRVGTLVVLTGKGLYGEHYIVGLRQMFIGLIQLRLGKHCADGLLKQFFLNIFHIIAVQDANTGETGDAQKVPGLTEKGPCLVGQFFFFLHIYAIYHLISPPGIRWPAVHAGRCLCGNRRCQSGSSPPDRKTRRWRLSGSPRCR